MIFERIETLLKNCITDPQDVPQTRNNHKGWMLRLTLDLFASIDLKDGRHPLTVPLGCRWYSKAMLPSGFLPEFQGDSTSESRTHADVFMGHFDIGNTARGDQSLLPDVRHFVVIEPKMYSRLSASIKKAAYLYHAEPDVLYITEVLKRAIRQMQEFKALGFYVLSSQINQGLFDEYLNRTSLRTVVERRADGNGDGHSRWLSGWFVPKLDRLDIKVICWEDLISVHCPDTEPLKTSILAAWN